MTTEPSPTPVCSRCRTPIPVDAPVPFCPPCLGQLAQENAEGGPNWRAVGFAVLAILFLLTLVVLSILHPQALERPPGGPAPGPTNTAPTSGTSPATLPRNPIPLLP